MTDRRPTGAPPKYTYTDNAAVLELLDKGITVREIERITGMSKSAVHRLKVKHLGKVK